jgi:hypothetical protein
MYAPGDFTFLKKDGDDTDVMLKDMYDAVSVSENWENLKGFVPQDGGFMFSEKPEWFSRIDKAVKYTGHSGASHGWTMRCIDYIAKHGWENFVTKMSKPDEATKKRLRILELPFSIAEKKNQLNAWKKRLESVDKTDYDSVQYLQAGVDEHNYEVEQLERELTRLMPPAPAPLQRSMSVAGGYCPE